MKVAVVTVQNYPKGFNPYFTFFGLDQTLKDINGFVDFTVNACIQVAEKFDNTVLLNHSTDGVSCDA